LKRLVIGAAGEWVSPDEVARAAEIYAQVAVNLAQAENKG
jgi:hypothetical protein